MSLVLSCLKRPSALSMKNLCREPSPQHLLLLLNKQPDLILSHTCSIPLSSSLSSTRTAAAGRPPSCCHRVYQQEVAIGSGVPLSDPFHQALLHSSAKLASFSFFLTVVRPGSSPSPSIHSTEPSTIKPVPRRVMSSRLLQI